jgi:hypothetical protein
LKKINFGSLHQVLQNFSRIAVVKLYYQMYLPHKLTFPHFDMSYNPVPSKHIMVSDSLLCGQQKYVLNKGLVFVIPAVIKAWSLGK